MLIPTPILKKGNMVLHSTANNGDFGEPLEMVKGLIVIHSECLMVPKSKWSVLANPYTDISITGLPQFGWNLYSLRGLGGVYCGKRLDQLSKDLEVSIRNVGLALSQGPNAMIHRGKPGRKPQLLGMEDVGSNCWGHPPAL